jgi:alpha-glutamyl/putrescinyl thymine pyrophosphorylase clade 1
MDISAINDPTTRFVSVMRERETIRLRRAQGLPRPWTADPILHSYRFCNIKREDDALPGGSASIGANRAQPMGISGSRWLSPVL